MSNVIRTVPAIFAAAFAATATLTANAAATNKDWNANGAHGTPESPLNINDPQYWGGVSPSSAYNLFFSDSSGEMNYLTNTHEFATMTSDNLNFNEGD